MTLLEVTEAHDEYISLISLPTYEIAVLTQFLRKINPPPAPVEIDSVGIVDLYFYVSVRWNPYSTLLVNT